jgi:hypothetical protein
MSLFQSIFFEGRLCNIFRTQAYVHLLPITQFDHYEEMADVHKNGVISTTATTGTDKYPNGQFLGFEIWHRDPSSYFNKLLWIVLTLSGLLYMVYSVHIVTSLMGLKGDWDDHHGLVTTNHIFLFSFLDLVAVTLELSRSNVLGIFGISFGVYGLLIVADILVGGNENINLSCSKTYPWPSSWKVENTICYNEMFCEPTRWGRFLRRPGNTLSNVTYLLSSLSVLMASPKSVFWMSDILFGLMLLILSVFSTLWHASNAPWSQYVDIWSMDCCILYLIVRYGCLGGQRVLVTVIGLDPIISQRLAGLVCLLIFGLVVLWLGILHWKRYQRRWLHGGCPFSARARLLGRGNVRGEGQEDCHISTVCLFASLPVLYTGIPTIIQVYLIGSVGSTTAAIWVFRTLVFGWTYRLCERWLLDGCNLMNFFTDHGQTSRIHILGASVVSPTAVLHFSTGLTLLTGYMHCRSVETFVSGANFGQY